MFELLGWFAFLITAMAMLYGYLKVEHSLLHENRLITVSGDGLAPHLEKAMLEIFGEIQRRAAEEKPSVLFARAAGSVPIRGDRRVFS